MSLLNQLNTLETTGLIRLATARPELEYLFRHALVQDAAYGSLLKHDRRQLHRAVGETLETLYPERLGEMASTLALHFEKAEEAGKALHYFTLAADRARASYANDEAIQFYRAALRAFDKAGESAALQARLTEALGDLLNLTGQREDARQNFSLLIARGTEPLTQARLQRKIALTYVDEQRFPEAEQHFARGAERLQHAPATTAEYRQERIQNTIDQFWMYYFQNKPERVEQLMRELPEWIETHGSPMQKARFYMGLAHIHLRRQRYAVSEEGLAHVVKAVTAAQATHDPNMLADMRFGYGFMALWHGSFALAEAQLEATLALCRQTGNVTTLARALTYLAVLHRMRKDTPRLHALLPELKQVLRVAGLKEYLPHVMTIEAWFAWQAGRFDEVEQLGHTALDIWATAVVAIPFQWLAHWPLLSVAVERGQFATAQQHAQAMLAPHQQKLPDDLTAALEAATQAEPAAAREPLETALWLAAQKGYW